MTRVADDGELEAETLAFARELAAGPGLAYRLMKHNLNVAESGDFDAVVDAECRNHMTALRSADHREAATAFAEKRAPRFVGR